MLRYWTAFQPVLDGSVMLDSIGNDSLQPTCMQTEQLKSATRQLQWSNLGQAVTLLPN